MLTLVLTKVRLSAHGLTPVCHSLYNKYRSQTVPMLPRSRELLHEIVAAYIETGEPVASRSIARRRGDTLSAASVRNVMADLDEEGYLCQPHTWAGRIT